MEELVTSINNYSLIMSRLEGLVDLKESVADNKINVKLVMLTTVINKNLANRLKN